MKKLILNGKPLASLRIVYGASPLTRSVGSQTGKTVGEDIGRFLQGENRACDFDLQSARRLAECVETLTGEMPVLLSSLDTEIQDGDILVGNVGSVELPADERDYLCCVDDASRRLWVYGGSFGATWHAVCALCKVLECIPDGGELSSVLPIEGRAPLRTVACLGDSITRGSQSLPDGNGFGTPDGLTASFGGAATSIYFEQYMSYPSNLQRALWKEYLVFNFGRGLATMRDLNPDPATGPFYYQRTPAYVKCKSYSDRSDFSFDAVLIMLGTNDSGRDGGAKTWGAEQRADYCNEARSLIASISAGSPEARFVLMTVPHNCDSHKISENNLVLRALQRECVKMLRQEGFDLSCYDMGAYSADHLGNGHGDTKEAEIEAHADFYNIRTETGKPDTTHPNYLGYATIAKGMEPLLRCLLEGAEAPGYLLDSASL